MKPENKQREDVDISIIIVNYNVKEFLANLISSIEKARNGFNLEIFVVDNASTDASLPFLKERFPYVTFIANDENIGFGRANNQAIKRASGKYVLLINPDTLVREDTLKILYEHMEDHPDCGAAGCKILNPDGSFAPESRRSVPTIWSALCKVLGLSTLFPNSKKFGRYYLSWKDPDEFDQVPVLSGSFMFFRREVLQKLGGFDERFFMYGEDIDLCYRLHQDTDKHIDYVPDTSIIHYKGESTKKDNLKYIKNFNKALYLFFDKHFTSRYSLLFRLLIYLGILIRAGFSFLKNKAQSYRGILLDLSIMNMTLLIGFPLRFGISLPELLEPAYVKFLWINLLVTVLYIAFSHSFEVIKRDPYLIIGSLKAVLATYTGVVFITFFIRTLAFSRLVLFLSGVVSFLLIGFIRLLRKNAHKNPSHSRGRIKPTRVFIVGMGDKTKQLIDKVRSRVDWDYEICGIIKRDNNETEPNNIDDIPIAGNLSQLPELIKAYKIDQLFFLLHTVSYKDLLQVLTEIKDENIVTKLIPDSMDFILGKSNVEYLADIPLIDVELAYQNAWNRFVKRGLELVIVLPIWLLMSPIALPAIYMSKARRKRIRIGEGREQSYLDLPLFYPFTNHFWKNLYVMFTNVVRGNLRLVGAPIMPLTEQESYMYEHGVTGLAQINANRIYSRRDREQFDIYYLQNYSIWQDLDILVRTLFNGPGPLSYIQQQYDRINS